MKCFFSLLVGILIGLSVFPSRGLRVPDLCRSKPLMSDLQIFSPALLFRVLFAQQAPFPHKVEVYTFDRVQFITFSFYRLCF